MTSTRTLLVVEDDPTARETLCDLLSEEGYRCLPAADGREAIGRLAGAEQLPCGILLDLMMPGMNGWQFREWQRAQAAFARIPVIVLSAVTNGPAEAERLQVAGFVGKPIQLDALLETLDRYCSAS